MQPFAARPSLCSFRNGLQAAQPPFAGILRRWIPARPYTCVVTPTAALDSKRGAARRRSFTSRRRYPRSSCNWPSRLTKTRNSRAQRPDGRRGGSASDVQYSAGSVEILFLQRLDRLSSGKNEQFNFAMLSIAFQLVCHR